MPLYDYRCESCGKEFEAERPISKRDAADCPACRSVKVKRVIRQVGFFGGGRGGQGAACAPKASGFG